MLNLRHFRVKYKVFEKKVFTKCFQFSTQNLCVVKYIYLYLYDFFESVCKVKEEKQ
jgi:hypothetical protein